MRHTISVLVENKFGVLARIVGLISGRGFNIDSLSVGETPGRDESRITLVVNGEDAIVEQVRKQLEKLVDVTKVNDLTKDEIIDRELALIRVSTNRGNIGKLLAIVEACNGTVVDASASAVTIETSGPEHKVQGLIELLREFRIKDIVRSGRIALPREKKELSQEHEV